MIRPVQSEMYACTDIRPVSDRTGLTDSNSGPVTKIYVGRGPGSSDIGQYEVYENECDLKRGFTAVRFLGSRFRSRSPLYAQCARRNPNKPWN